MEISKIIAQSASELFVWLEETYNININETTAKWSELTGMNITIRDGSELESKVKVTKKREPKAKKIPKIKDTKDLDVNLCQHMFQIGAKAGEQCSKKPKNGSFCSAHTKKTSVKSNKEEPKKKEKKAVDREIDSNFESADDKKKKTNKKKKSPISKAEVPPSDSEEEAAAVAKMKKLKTGVNPATGKKIIISSGDDTDDDEPTVKPAPLLNKNKGKKQPVYDTDDEKIDANLDLSEDSDE